MEQDHQEPSSKGETIQLVDCNFGVHGRFVDNIRCPSSCIFIAKSDLPDRAETTKEIIHFFGCDFEGQVFDEEDCLCVRMRVISSYLRSGGLAWPYVHAHVDDGEASRKLRSKKVEYDRRFFLP